MISSPGPIHKCILGGGRVSNFPHPSGANSRCGAAGLRVQTSPSLDCLWPSTRLSPGSSTLVEEFFLPPGLICPSKGNMVQSRSGFVEPNLNNLSYFQLPGQAFTGTLEWKSPWRDGEWKGKRGGFPARPAPLRRRDPRFRLHLLRCSCNLWGP